LGTGTRPWSESRRSASLSTSWAPLGMLPEGGRRRTYRDLGPSRRYVRFERPPARRLTAKGPSRPACCSSQLEIRSGSIRTAEPKSCITLASASSLHPVPGWRSTCDVGYRQNQIQASAWLTQESVEG